MQQLQRCSSATGDGTLWPFNDTVSFLASIWRFRFRCVAASVPLPSTARSNPWLLHDITPPCASLHCPKSAAARSGGRPTLHVPPYNLHGQVLMQLNAAQRQPETQSHLDGRKAHQQTCWRVAWRSTLLTCDPPVLSRFHIAELRAAASAGYSVCQLSIWWLRFPPGKSQQLPCCPRSW